MGLPRQEKWLAEHRDRIDARFCMGVGGLFDVLAGRVKRAPVAFQMTGTEWLYRLIADPKRLRGQIVLPLFVLSVFRQLFMAKVERLFQVGGRPLELQDDLQPGVARDRGAKNGPVITIKDTAVAGLAPGPKTWTRRTTRPFMAESWRGATTRREKTPALLPPE